MYADIAVLSRPSHKPGLGVLIAAETAEKSVLGDSVVHSSVPLVLVAAAWQLPEEVAR